MDKHRFRFSVRAAKYNQWCICGVGVDFSQTHFLLNSQTAFTESWIVLLCFGMVAYTAAVHRAYFIVCQFLHC